jgi:adenylosuccinate lyase
MEGVALWHERDISHSSVERICVPDAASLAEYIVVCTTDVVKNLDVNRPQMASTLAHSVGSIYSEDALVALTTVGVRRDVAHAAVERAAAECTSGRSFQTCLEYEVSRAGLHLDSVDLSQIGRINTAPDRLRHVRQRIEALADPVVDVHWAR